MRTAQSEPYREHGWLERVAVRLRERLAGRSGYTQLRAIYRFMLRTQNGSRGFECRLPLGERVQLDVAFRHVTWNPVEYAALREATQPGSVVLDIGANAGSYSLLFGQWVGSSGSVHAFEPARALFDGLRRHIALNRLENVHAHRSAVSDTSGVARFDEGAFSGQGHLLDPDEPGGVPVPTISIDDFCAREQLRPDLIKIDVEGDELAVLRGAARTIREANGSIALFVELHPSRWAIRGESFESFKREIAGLGLVVQPLGGAAEFREGECVQLLWSGT